MVIHSGDHFGGRRIRALYLGVCSWFEICENVSCPCFPNKLSNDSFEMSLKDSSTNCNRSTQAAWPVSAEQREHLQGRDQQRLSGGQSVTKIVDLAAGDAGGRGEIQRFLDERKRERQQSGRSAVGERTERVSPVRLLSQQFSTLSLTRIEIVIKARWVPSKTTNSAISTRVRARNTENPGWFREPIYLCKNKKVNWKMIMMKIVLRAIFMN